MGQKGKVGKEHYVCVLSINIFKSFDDNPIKVYIFRFLFLAEKHMKSWLLYLKLSDLDNFCSV